LSGDQIKSSLEAFPASYEALVLACDARARKANERAFKTEQSFSSTVQPAKDTILNLPNLIAPDQKEPSRILGNLFFSKQPIQQSDSNASSLEVFANQHR
jgi:hypothetical protein